jgi:xanthine dehydrogenase accessory factor
MNLRVLVRGGGDLASGAILRIGRAGWDVLVTELDKPLSVRRLVSFSQAIYEGATFVEDMPARRITNLEEAENALASGNVAVIADPNGNSIQWFHPDVIIDARMIKHYDVEMSGAFPLYIGLGPGFTAPNNCHAVIETKRGPYLGRVIWHGSAEKDTGIPEMVNGFQGERVLRAPVSGIVKALAEIGQVVSQDEEIAIVGGVRVKAAFPGIVRGLIQPDLYVQQGMKIGDLDPRSDPNLCRLVSDKALAVGGGVIEAILSYPLLRERLRQ